MLRQYIKTNELTIPYSDNVYTINVEGIIKNILTGEIVKPEENGIYLLKLFNCLSKYDITWLMAITFKPVYNSSVFIKNWTVLKNSENKLDLAELIWKPPLGGQDDPFLNGFKIIPGFSKYCINRYGVVYNRERNFYVSTRQANFRVENTYINFNIECDNGYRTVLGVHRAIGLAFIEYTPNVNQLTINHIDGNKFNNDLINLEWVTYSDNNIHAMNTKLRDVKLEIFIKDYHTGTVNRFNSLTDGANYLEMNSGTLHYFLKKQSLIKFRYFVKIVDNDWPLYKKTELEAFEKIYNLHKNDLKCYAKDIVTGMKYLADSPTKLANVLNFTKDEVRTAVESPFAWPVRGLVFGFLSSPKPDRKYTEDEIIAFKNKRGIKNPIHVTDPNGSVKVYCSPREFSRFLSKGNRYVSDCLYSNNGAAIIDGYKVRYIV
jgi:hypothetical protein